MNIRLTQSIHTITIYEKYIRGITFNGYNTNSRTFVGVYTVQHAGQCGLGTYSTWALESFLGFFQRNKTNCFQLQQLDL